MSLIWGFGAPLTGPARPKYSTFLQELIQKAFMPSTNAFEFLKRVDMNLFPKSNCNLFSLFFHTKDCLWHKWDYEIEKYDILGDKESQHEVTVDRTKNTNEDQESEKDDTQSNASGAEGQFDEEFSNKVEFQNIMVATEDTIQQQFIMETIVGH